MKNEFYTVKVTTQHPIIVESEATLETFVELMQRAHSLPKENVEFFRVPKEVWDAAEDDDQMSAIINEARAITKIVEIQS